jgi:hypothetical protein
MISPMATGELLLKLAPQWGQVVASSAIIRPHARHEVIRLILTSLPPPFWSAIAER